MMENSNTAVIGHSVSTGGRASLVLGCFQRGKMKVHCRTFVILNINKNYSLFQILINKEKFT